MAKMLLSVHCSNFRKPGTSTIVPKPFLIFRAEHQDWSSPGTRVPHSVPQWSPQPINQSTCRLPWELHLISSWQHNSMNWKPEVCSSPASEIPKKLHVSSQTGTSLVMRWGKPKKPSITEMSDLFIWFAPFVPQAHSAGSLNSIFPSSPLHHQNRKNR